MLSAAPIPQSGCSFFDPSMPNEGFSCNLYPSDPGGNFSGDVIVQFPAGWNIIFDPIAPGYLVLTDNGASLVSDPNNQFGADDPNIGDWTQILEFEPVGADSATQLELFTVGCNSVSNPYDTSCFPDYNTLLAQAFFDAEPSNNVYIFAPCPVCSIDHAYVLTFIPSPVTGAPEP